MGEAGDHSVHQRSVSTRSTPLVDRTCVSPWGCRRTEKGTRRFLRRLRFGACFRFVASRGRTTASRLRESPPSKDRPCPAKSRSGFHSRRSPPSGSLLARLIAGPCGFRPVHRAQNGSAPVLDESGTKNPRLQSNGAREPLVRLHESFF